MHSHNTSIGNHINLTNDAYVMTILKNHQKRLSNFFQLNGIHFTSFLSGNNNNVNKEGSKSDVVGFCSDDSKKGFQIKHFQKSNRLQHLDEQFFDNLETILNNNYINNSNLHLTEFLLSCHRVWIEKSCKFASPYFTPNELSNILDVINDIRVKQVLLHSFFISRSSQSTPADYFIACLMKYKRAKNMFIENVNSEKLYLSSTCNLVTYLETLEWRFNESNKGFILVDNSINRGTIILQVIRK